MTLLLGRNQTYGLEDGEGSLGEWLVLGYGTMPRGHQPGVVQRQGVQPPRAHHLQVGGHHVLGHQCLDAKSPESVLDE